MLSRKFNIAGTLVILLITNVANAYDNQYVHPSINEHVVRQSENISPVLKNLGFISGIDNLVNGKEIYKWFRDGGTLEDETPCRARNHFHDPTKKPWSASGSRTSNHFHDPLKPWSSAGFKGSWLDRSSLVWAQDQRPEEANGWSNLSWPKVVPNKRHSATVAAECRLFELSVASCKISGVLGIMS